MARAPMASIGSPAPRVTSSSGFRRSVIALLARLCMTVVRLRRGATMGSRGVLYPRHFVIHVGV